jgi:hypothetical protein
LYGCTTTEQLDAAYAAEVAASYSGMLAQAQQPDEAAQQLVAKQWQHYQQQLSKTAVWNIMMRVSSSSVLVCFCSRRSAAVALACVVLL